MTGQSRPDARQGVQIMFRGRPSTIVLRPVMPSDVETLYRWSTAPDVAYTWRYRGATPSLTEFSEHLWQSVLAQFMCVHRSTGEAVGFVSVYQANLNARRAHMSLLIAPEHRGRVAALEGFTAALAYTFDVWPLEKIYFETNSRAVEKYQTLVESELISEEARLVDYEQFGNGTADLIYLSMSRAQFNRLADHYGV